VHQSGASVEPLPENVSALGAGGLTADSVGSSVPRDIPATRIGWNMMKSSSAQVVGRIVVALARLVVAGMIIRRYHESIFGEYSLIFGLLSIGDWLVDFGTTEVFVRDICREPERAQRLLRILAATKMAQAPAAFAALTGLLLALRYPSQIVAAGLIGGANIVFFAGVLVYRVVFRVTLTIERESLAECLSVLVMIPLIALVCRAGGGLIALVGCHVISRAVFLGACSFFGRRQFVPSIAGVQWPDVVSAFHSSMAIGIIGFLVGGYETLDILVLSKFSNFSEVAVYSAAQRLVWPTLMALSAVGATFYPVIASYWPHAREQFEQTCQRGLDTMFLLAGVALSSLFAGAPFYMGLLGHKLSSGYPVLRVLAVLALIKAITGTIGPILYIVRAQKHALRFIAVALMVKLIAIAVVAPRFGYMGVAVAALVVEALFATLPSVYLVQRLTKYRLRWGVAVKATLWMSLSSVVASLVVGAGGFVAALLAPLLYTGLIFATGAVRPAELRLLLKSRAA